MRLLLSFIIFIIFNGKNCFAQVTIDALQHDSTKLYVEYAFYNGYVNDSVYNSLGYGRLFLEKKGSIYIYQRESVAAFLDKFGASITEEKTRKVVMDGIKQRDLEKQLSIVGAKYYNSPDYLSLKKFNDGDVWVSDTLHFQFKTLSDFKIVSGYKCQKAVGKNASGNEIIAWFTEDIPIPAGPANVFGLPGLILEVQSPIKKILYRAVLISSTTFPTQKFRKWLAGPIISNAEYIEKYNGETKKMEQFKSMIESDHSYSGVNK